MKTTYKMNNKKISKKALVEKIGKDRVERLTKVLDKLYRYDGVVMSRAEHVKSSIES